MSDLLLEVIELWASTRAYHPLAFWEWRISRDVAEAVTEQFRPGGDPDRLTRLFGWPVKVVEGATAGTIGVVCG